MNNEDGIKLSIIVLTYNHENYIQQNLDSIIKQKVTFKYEILIGDDYSSDGTQEIIKEYKKKFPDIIKLYLNENNLGATKNIYKLYKNALGKYIAQVEGDDYWSDELKLEKQMFFLENNNEYIACSHLCTVVDEEGNIVKEKNQNNIDTYWYYSKAEFTLNDCKNGKYPGHFASIFFRNIFKKPKYDYSIIYKAHKIIGDRTLIAVLSMQGKIYRINESMSCYRLVEKKTANNWQSIARQKNKRYEEYHYLRQLERYVQKETKKEFFMLNVRKEKLICATVVLLNKFSLENLKVVFLMIMDSGCILKSLILFVSTIVQKIYYRKICGEDKPVKY